MTFVDGMGSIFNLKSMGPIGCLVDGQAFAFGTDYHLKVSAEEFVNRPTSIQGVGISEETSAGSRVTRPRLDFSSSWMIIEVPMVAVSGNGATDRHHILLAIRNGAVIRTQSGHALASYEPIASDTQPACATPSVAFSVLLHATGGKRFYDQ